VTKSNSKKHYQENKSYYLARNKEQVRKLQEMIREAKSVPCMDCKKPFPYYVMDFDHVRGKKLFNISEGFRLCAPLKMAAEIAKCDVVCANCHRERTQVRFESGREC
jgi:cytochrome P450